MSELKLTERRIVKLVPNGETPWPSTLQKYLVAEDTAAQIREVNGALLALLKPFMDGRLGADGTGVTVQGELRYILDIRKFRNESGIDDPLQVEKLRKTVVRNGKKHRIWVPADSDEGDEVEFESFGEASRALGERVKWAAPALKMWKRVTALTAFPFLFIVDIRVTEPSIGERAALVPLLETAKRIGLPFRFFLADGGFNGTLIRDLIAGYGAMPVIPYPINAVNAYNPELESVIGHVDVLREAFRIYKEDPDRFRRLYTSRSKVENVFSVLKRDAPKIVHRSHHGPEVQMLMRVLRYNVRRACLLLALVGDRAA